MLAIRCAEDYSVEPTNGEPPTIMATARALLGTAERRLRGMRFGEAASCADDGLKLLLHEHRHRATLGLRVTFHNLRGIALHLMGETAQAHAALSTAIDEATHAAVAGQGGDDAYMDVGGALNDLAANYIVSGDLEAADAALKRATYMLKRAYRPSAVARACVLNMRGCLLERHGDYAAALESHEEAHALLCAAHVADGQHAQHAGWVQAARHGSVWAMLRLGHAPAAATLSAADLSEERMEPLDLRERAFARGRHAVAVLQQQQHDGSSAVPTESHDDQARAADQALRELQGVAESLAVCLGPAHPETQRAESNLLLAHAATRRNTSASPEPLPWQQPWQPALGVGLRSALLGGQDLPS